MTTNRRTFAKRFNAQRAARALLGASAAEGERFRTVLADDGGWTFEVIDAEPAWNEVANAPQEVAIAAPAPVADLAPRSPAERIEARKARATRAAASVTPPLTPSELQKARSERHRRKPVDGAATPKPEPKPSKRALAEESARAGTLPTAPDFTAPTHARFRAKLAEVVTLVDARDVAGLRGFAIEPISSSRTAIDRYRNLCIMAIEAGAAT